MSPVARNQVVAGRYELLEIIGKGGMAVVWRAIDGASKRTVAVKRVLGELSADPGIKALFLEEARVGQTLHHANIVETFDFGKDEKGAYFLVLEWVDGLDLYEYMRAFHRTQGHVPWQSVALVAHQALQGLVAAHERTDASGQSLPVIHRDLTPSNVLVGVDGVVKLADFGLARAMDRASMTLPHMIKGKLSYTAPEMLRGQKASVRTDIYCLGLTLWECLAGKKLFAGGTQIEVLENVEQARVPPIERFRPDAPRPLLAAVMKAVCRDPKDRYSSAREMDASIAELLRSMPQPMDEARLGASVRQAMNRLLPAVAPAAKIERVDDDILEVSAELVVDYASSPSALRSLQIELIEEIEEEALRSTSAAKAPKPPRRKPPPPPPVKKEAPRTVEPEPATPLGLGWPYGRAPRPNKKSP
jgi:serine/threonine-protein kinase